MPNPKFKLLIPFCICFGFALCSSVIADEGEIQCKQQYMDCMVQYNVKQDEYKKIEATKITTKQCKEKRTDCEKSGGSNNGLTCNEIMNECFVNKSDHNREIEKKLSILNKSIRQIESQCEQHYRDCESANYDAKQAQKLADEREVKETEKLKKQTDSQQALEAKKEQQKQDTENQNIARIEYQKNAMDMQAKFQQEHPDFVPIDGFKFLKFGMSKEDVDQVLIDNGVNQKQYKRGNSYIIERLPVYQQNLYASLTYDQKTGALNEILIGTLDVQSFSIETTGVVFIDSNPKNATSYPAVKDGEQLVKSALKKWRNVVAHNKDEYNASNGTTINIETYVLNYGTFVMKVREYNIPKKVKENLRKQVGWYNKNMTIVSLVYYDLAKGIELSDQIKIKKETQNKRTTVNGSSF